MTTAEIKTFIETMEEMGDAWTPEQVQDVYGSKSLSEALEDRKKTLGQFTDNITKILNR